MRFFDVSLIKLTRWMWVNIGVSHWEQTKKETKVDHFNSGCGWGLS